MSSKNSTPKASPKSKKRNTIQVCVTESMAKEIDALIQKSDSAFTSRSEFVRHIIMNKLGH